MWIELPVAWVVVLNIVTLAAIQIGCAWMFTRLPGQWFDRPLDPAPLRRTRTSAFLKTWKCWLPDGASWFAGGFRKRSLASKDETYLLRFVKETRRGERCHWLAMWLCAVPFAWNPWWGCVVIGLYAVSANLPCIVLQRVNRRRLSNVLGRLQASNADAKSARS